MLCYFWCEPSRPVNPSAAICALPSGGYHHLGQKVCDLGDQGQRPWYQGPAACGLFCICTLKFMLRVSFRYVEFEPWPLESPSLESPSPSCCIATKSRIGLVQKLPICGACWFTPCIFAREVSLQGHQRSNSWSNFFPIWRPKARGSSKFQSRKFS